MSHAANPGEDLGRAARWGVSGEGEELAPREVCGKQWLAEVSRSRGLGALSVNLHPRGTALAWQNTAYNQPPHPSFFIGNGMATAPRPSIFTP